ncbi:uncharacterized protein LOC135490883 [Lineus longissimus]|uniref:uncharacterized protein LOC135490883 n=1 Tax=Lineus longissimus TaxID=88925 RepID=UPI002B4C2871
MDKMWNLISLCSTFFFILQSGITLGCSVPFSPIPPTINEKVFHSDVVLSGKVVGKQLDLQRSMFGSPVYTAHLKVYCIYKGEATPQNLTVSTVGDPGSNCPSIHLRVRQEYILLLTRTADGRYVPTYFPEAFTHGTMTDVLKMCGVRSLHPTLSRDERILMSCGAVSHGDCIPHEPHIKPPITTPQPQIVAPTTTPAAEVKLQPKMEQKSTKMPMTTTGRTTTSMLPTATTMEEVETATTATTTKTKSTTMSAPTMKSEKSPSKEKERQKMNRNSKYESSDPRDEPNDAMGMTVEVMSEPVATQTKSKSEEKKTIEKKEKREPALDAVVDSKGSAEALRISIACVVMTLVVTLLMKQ